MKTLPYTPSWSLCSKSYRFLSIPKITACKYKWMCVCLFLCIFAYIHECMHVRMCIHMCIKGSVHVRMSMCVHVLHRKPVYTLEIMRIMVKSAHWQLEVVCKHLYSYDWKTTGYGWISLTRAIPKSHLPIRHPHSMPMSGRWMQWSATLTLFSNIGRTMTKWSDFILCWHTVTKPLFIWKGV